MTKTRDLPGTVAACLVAFTVALTSLAVAADPVRVRVLTYNVHHGEGVDGRLDVERIANVIRAAEPDIVALQEVDREAMRTGSVDQPAELARLTGLNVVFGANIPLQGGEYGNAVLSRWPIARRINHRLPNFDEGERRGLLEVEIAGPRADERLLLFATHFDHRSPNRERIASAKSINQRLSEFPERPAILAGDLNDTPDSPTLRMLEREWTRSGDQKLATVPVSKPERQIDFVLHRPASRWKVVEVTVLEEAVASDHRPLLAVLELLDRTVEEVGSDSASDGDDNLVE